jgi:hypothetical protein
MALARRRAGKRIGKLRQDIAKLDDLSAAITSMRRSFASLAARP